MFKRSLFGALVAATTMVTSVACGTSGTNPIAPTAGGAFATGASSDSATTSAPRIVPTTRQSKTDLCHRTNGDAFVLITVAMASLDAHLQHGDGRVGDAVPGRAGMIFGAECTLITSCTAPPGKPGFLGWTTAGLPSGSVRLEWEAATGTVTSYVVEIGTTVGGTEGGVLDTGSTATSYPLTGLIPSVDYYHVRVRAKNACGVSESSNEANPRIS